MSQKQRGASHASHLNSGWMLCCMHVWMVDGAVAAYDDDADALRVDLVRSGGPLSDAAPSGRGRLAGVRRGLCHQVCAIVVAADDGRAERAGLARRGNARSLTLAGTHRVGISASHLDLDVHG